MVRQMLEPQKLRQITRLKVTLRDIVKQIRAQSSPTPNFNDSKKCLLKPLRPFAGYAKLQHLYKPSSPQKCPRHCQQ